MAPRAGLLATFALTVILTAGMAWLLVRKGTGLQPVRASTFELDEPPPDVPPHRAPSR